MIDAVRPMNKIKCQYSAAFSCDVYPSLEWWSRVRSFLIKYKTGTSGVVDNEPELTKHAFFKERESRLFV